MTSPAAVAVFLFAVWDEKTGGMLTGKRMATSGAIQLADGYADIASMVLVSETDVDATGFYTATVV